MDLSEMKSFPRSASNSKTTYCATWIISPKRRFPWYGKWEEAGRGKTITASDHLDHSFPLGSHQAQQSQTGTTALPPVRGRASKPSLLKDK